MASSSVNSAPGRKFHIETLDGWNRSYYPSGGFDLGRHQGYVGSVEEVLLPMRFISDSDLVQTGNIRVAGREAIVIESTTRKQNIDFSGSPLEREWDQHELVVDLELGILLRLTSSHRGRPVCGHEDTPDKVRRSAARARWDETSEIVGLLYEAKRSFSTRGCRVEDGTATRYPIGLPPESRRPICGSTTVTSPTTYSRSSQNPG